MKRSMGGSAPKLAGRAVSSAAPVARLGLAIGLIEQERQSRFGFCSRALVLQYGRVVLEGEVAELEKAELVRKIYLGGETIAA